MRRIHSSLLGLVLAFFLAACGSGFQAPLLDTAEVVSAPTGRPPAPSAVSPASLPQICNCTLRFDHLNIEQGLSQSSIQVIFQDSHGFLWFGTEDGLNRYDGYNFKIYKPDPDAPNSLSDRWITSIVEDRDGYLWVGTRLGLNRYDPRTEDFLRFVHDDLDPSSLIDNHVNVLYIDRSGNLWIGTDSGLDLFDKGNGTFKHYVYSPFQQEGISGKSITALYQDSRGRLWVGTLAGGLNLFEPFTGKFTTYQSDPENPSTITNNHVTAIIEDKKSSVLWVGTGAGLNKFHPDSGTFERFMHSEDDQQSIASDTVYDLYVDSTGNLWIGTAAGLDRLSVTGKRFIHYRHDPTFSKSLSEDEVLSIYEDRGGVLWFGTWGGGVNKYDRQRDLFAYYRNDPRNKNSLSDNSIVSIYSDSEGYTWIGTAGEGLDRLTKLTSQVVHYRHNPDRPNSISSDFIYAIDEDQYGFMWIGTYNGLERFDRDSSTFRHYQRDPERPDSLSANRVYEVYVDSQNNVWLGTAAGLDLLNRGRGTFIHYQPKIEDPNSLSGPAVNSIYEDREGNLWIGTWESGLNKFNPKTQEFTRYRFDARNREGISSDVILSIYQDSKGRLWIGTGGGGLNLYHPETDTFTAYYEKDGLPNGVVYGILEDSSGFLWMSTNFGISRFNPEKQTFRNFDAGDGLQSNEFNSGAYAKGRNGELYFGGINGLTVFQPSSIGDSHYLPQVALTSLTQDDSPIVTTDSSVETAQKVILHWPQNSFEFEFAALSFSQPNKNQYAYMLEGFDNAWHFVGTKRDGRYTNLPGGEYTLLLKASNSDGIWTETPVRIDITVIPPFWQTVWFRVLLSVAVVAVVAGGYRLRTKTIQDRNRALERIVKERTYALEKRGREMEALYQADEKILRNVSLNQVFQTLVNVAVDMLHADRSVVFSWDKEKNKVVPHVSHGFKPETLKVMEFAEGEGIVGQVFATGKPVVVTDIILEDLRPDVRAAIREEGIKSFVHLPIAVDHKVVAVFNIGFTRPDFIPEDTVRVFSALVNRAAISIAKMELFEQTKDLAVMEERNRLARDLHDSAKQKAFAALAQLGTARGILNGHGNSATIHLNEAENLVTDVIQELTFLVQEIYPIALQEKGLVPTLRDYIFEWENRNDMAVQLVTRDERRLQLEVEQALYRVTQEALANVARHSHARRVDLSLVYNGDSVQLSVADDGCGFEVNAKHGMGLRSIRERVSSIRGTVQIQSAPGHGTRLLVQVPTKS